MFENLKDQKIPLSYIKQVFKTQGFGVIIIKSYNYTKKIVYLLLPTPIKILLAKKIKRFHSDSIDDVIRFCFYTLGGFIRPVQIESEFKDFLTLFHSINPKRVLEVGTDKGGSLFAMCKLAPADATIISLDLPPGELCGYPAWKERIYMMFKKEKQTLYLHRGDSQSENTLSEIKGILNGELLDFLFIDADHRYDGVKKDFQLYSSIVKKGGIVAFHDIAPTNPITEVPIFWNEIKKDYEYVEFIESQNQVGYGIGCIYIK